MRRWQVFMCWQGTAATLVPQPTKYRYLTRRGAERFAARLSAAVQGGRWYEARRVSPA